RTRRPRRGAVPRFHRPGPGGARRHRLRHRRAGPRPHRGVGLPPRPRARHRPARHREPAPGVRARHRPGPGGRGASRPAGGRRRTATPRRPRTAGPLPRLVPPGRGLAGAVRGGEPRRDGRRLDRRRPSAVAAGGVGDGRVPGARGLRAAAAHRRGPGQEVPAAGAAPDGELDGRDHPRGRRERGRSARRPRGPHRRRRDHGVHLDVRPRRARALRRGARRPDGRRTVVAPCWESAERAGTRRSGGARPLPVPRSMDTITVPTSGGSSMPIATPEQYKDMLDRARKEGFAYPAINCTSSETINAAIKGFADAGSDGIIQFSTGGSEFGSGLSVKDMVTGAVALAEFAHIVAAKYDVLVALHTDHCPEDKLDTFVRPLIEISQERVDRGENPLFQSHMWDGSATPLDRNLQIAEELLEKTANAKQILEIEIGVVGGEEDGVEN